MSLTGVTAFFAKNNLVGPTADIVRAMLAGAVKSAPEKSKKAPPKKDAKSNKAATKGKTSKDTKVREEENPVNEVTLVKKWANEKGEDVTLIIGPSIDAVKKTVQLVNTSHSCHIAQAANVELKKAGYVGVIIPANRKKAADAAIEYFEENELPMVASDDELGAEAEKPATKKGKKRVDESPEASEEEEEEEDEEEEDEEDEEEEEEEEEEEAPPKKGKSKPKRD